MERILISDLKVFAHHGVLPGEMEKGQDFLFDVEIEVDSSAAIEGDDISETVDYTKVADSVSRIATGERYNLIETLAAKIAEYLIALPGARKATVTVKKPEAPLSVSVGWVGVSVSRERGTG
ncbi:MAG: dihydroneopterin aldolase [Actinobacteria bacterium]|nr:dihydroneopterin aldolase [Actinomycetota bacterium]